MKTTTMNIIGKLAIFVQLLTLVVCDNYKTVDLCLMKKPRNIRSDWKPNYHKMRDLMTQAAIVNEAQNKTGGRYDLNSPSASERSHVGTKTPVLGSTDFVTDTGHDAGLLSTIFEAYSNHYNLRTGPEDWWFTIVQMIATEIDRNSKTDAVRDFFVQHEGKKTLAVKVGEGPLNVENINYDWLFDQFSTQIEENINVPEYVQQMIPDFSTTTNIHRIVSQVTLMSSVQEFFEYRSYSSCGIPVVEMKGTEEDWINLGLKIKALRKTLEPLNDVLFYDFNDYNYDSWWDAVEDIALYLLETFNGYPDEDWWGRIIYAKK